VGEELVPADDAVSEGLPHFEKAVVAAARGDIAGAGAELLKIYSASIVRWYVEHALWAEM
jgi:hypothetical protein